MLPAFLLYCPINHKEVTMIELRYRTEDGVMLVEGERAYDYYNMKPGTIGASAGSEGWFDFHHDDGTTCLLNGQRICSVDFAVRRNFKGAS